MSELNEAFNSIGVVCSGASIVYTAPKENTIYFIYKNKKYKMKLEAISTKTKTLKNGK
jgi:hypothetical protein